MALVWHLPYDASNYIKIRTLRIGTMYKYALKEPLYMIQATENVCVGAIQSTSVVENNEKKPVQRGGYRIVRKR